MMREELWKDLSIGIGKVLQILGVLWPSCMLKNTDTQETIKYDFLE